jgi:hypothetical protein
VLLRVKLDVKYSSSAFSSIVSILCGSMDKTTSVFFSYHSLSF